MGGFQTQRKILAGNTMVVEAIESQNYVEGVSGFSIQADGDVEFNDGVFRGELTANSISATSIGNSTITGSDIQGGTQEDPNITFTSAGGGTLLTYANVTTSATFTTSGAYVVPAGVTTVKVQAWGGGGGGQSGSGGGGGGGEYAAENALAVTAGESLTVTIGAGGAGGPSGAGGPGSDGGTTTVKRSGTTLVSAHGGKGSINFGNNAGGTGSTNSVHFNGGSAQIGTAGVKLGGGGGGSSAGTGSTGNTGKPNSGITGGAGGAAPTGGGKGGNGGTGSTGSTPTAGQAGSAPGGGGGTGGAGAATNAAGGAGARGQVTFTATTSQTLIASVSPVAGTDQYGNAYPAGVGATDVQIGGTSIGRGIVASVGTTTQASAIGTTPTAVLTLPSTVYKANRAYRAYLRAGISSATAGEWGYSTLMKTNTSGQTLGEFLRTPIPTVSDVYNQNGWLDFLVGGSDVTASLVVTLRAKSATVNQFANSTAPRYLTVEDIGDAVAYAAQNTALITLV
jgi:hypothetical protein